MHVQVLSSGSEGNSCLVRAGEISVLVDAGLPPGRLYERFEASRVTPRMIDHVVVTHGHLDHARSAGVIGKKHDATVHCAQNIMRHRAVLRAPRLSTLKIGSRFVLENAKTQDELGVTCIELPHDCDPTVAIRLDHDGRSCVVLTDMGVPREEIARRLRGAEVLVLEFNYDPAMLEVGPYSDALKKRISSGRGHLSNAEAGRMLEWMATAELHTLVLAHISQRNNTPELALREARASLERIGRSDVEVLVASQHEIGPNLKV